MPIPSKRTIETLSNHGLLEVLNAGKVAPPFAWLQIPTQTEEADLGFDAELQGYKRLYIQYKRRNESGSFTFDFGQIWLLCSLFTRHQQPYVFLSGNDAPDYAQQLR